MEEERPPRKSDHVIGSDLSLLSADELKLRITLVEQEIERLKTALSTKAEGRMAAEALFSRKP
ncbi:DUF1192 domain-containing protein [Allorhizobium undicola]|uniref:DUF1192 domain-containing protein n=1 Tax=Allorhizobium undicola TaxID=78527 RepID=UPI00048A3B61|nr:DUF1192 domain-containing protein [Allorhizobium undicola]